MKKVIQTKALNVSEQGQLLWVTMCGIQDSFAATMYLKFIDSFIKRTPDNWYRVIDLRQWQVTLPEVNREMIAHLNREINAGLVFEAVIMPSEHLGRWQIEKTIQQTIKPDIFHLVESCDEALALLHRKGLAPASFKDAFATAL